MYKTGYVIGGIVMNAIIVLVIAYLGTGSLNPIEVFRGDSLLLKVLEGVFLFFFAAGFLHLLIIRALRDKVCNKCGKPLLAYADVSGKPLRCNYCGQWYHTHCLRADGGSALRGCKQPGCPSASTGP